MTEKYITYKMDGKTFEVPESMSSKVEEKYPSATIEMRMGEKRFDVPISHKQDAINKYGSDLLYAFDKSPVAEESPQSIAAEASSIDNTKDENDRTTLAESAIKGIGSGFVRLGKSGLDAINILSAKHKERDPYGNIVAETPDYDTMVRENFQNIQWSDKMGELADRLSKEADPTGGEQGYVDLISEGKIGKALQKGLASAGESLPATLSAKNPYTMLLYAALTSASNYAEETKENPDMPKWKRAARAVGSAALETAVEKFADPIFKYIGGKSGAGEITEEAAKEIIEKGTKEATDGIAKRIFNVLKNVGKDMGGEGVEEFVTSAGDDVLGQALDLISGDNDYGYVAQWEQMKEQNPDADLGDFAKVKAKEYMDSFIGGALSTPYMSGTAQGVQHIQQRAERNAMQNAYNDGSSMDYNNMYDTDDVVREDLNRVVGAFTNENGEQSISNEFIEMLSSEDAYHLSQNEDLSGEQRSALSQLAIDRARQEGLTKALDDRLNNSINANRILVEAASDENGSIVVGIVEGTPVFVKGGVVNNGFVTLSNGESGPVIAYDVRTGEQRTVQSNQISAAVVDNAENFANTVEEGLRMNEKARRDQARTTMSPIAKFKAVMPYAGKKMMVDLGNGITEVDVLQVLPQSQQVVIKGKKADLGGQSITKIGADVFYDSISRDDDGNPMFVEGVQETEAIEQNSTEDVDYRGENVSILINGVPTNVEVVSQDTPSDTIVYEYTDENGNSRRGSSTIEAFQSAIQQTQEQTSDIVPETTPESPVEDTPAETTPEVSEEPAPQEEPEQIQLNPDDIDWDALFEQDPWAYFSELQNQFGEGAIDFINNEIAATEEEIAKLDKHKGGSKSERVANLQKKSKLKLQLGTLYEMLNKLSSSPATEVAPEAPVAEIPTTEVTEEPAPVEDVPVSESPEPAPVEETPTETPVAETPTEPQPTAPVAPTPVDDPVREAQKREKSLATQIKRLGIPHEQKQDMAFNAGKAVADFFATREEYEAYSENATDFGEYNADFERGVEASFANRSKIESIPQINEVPLENEPNGDINGEQGETTTEGSTEGRGDNTPGEGNDTGSTQGAEGNTPTKPSRTGKGKGGKKKQSVTEKYPARNGNATQKLLVDTFGFESVTIPNTRKEILNTIYDFMMEMSKTLGISPKSIGHGGWLRVGNMRSNKNAIAAHQIASNLLTGEIAEVSLLFKYARLSSIAHEWWHSLDRALGYFNTRKLEAPTTEVGETLFTGRKETWDAVKGVMDAISNSGYTSRIEKIVKGERRTVREYFLSPTEQAARAFDEYITNRFAKAGITIENYDNHRDVTQPTAEEMKVITPAIENLFKVLKEKEGKRPGTSVLYHISEEMEPQSDSKKFATESILTALDDGNREVVIMEDEQTKQYLKSIGADTDTQFSIDTDKPIFLSNAAVAVIGIKQEKATPEQWLKMIEKAGGLKAGEDKWMGLSDWLKAQDAKTLTKQEVLDYIHDNEIQIEEEHYSDSAEDNATIVYGQMRDILQGEFNHYRAEYYKEHEDDDFYGNPAADYAIEKLRDYFGDTQFPYDIEVDNSGDVYFTFYHEDDTDMKKWAGKLGVKYEPQNPINSTRQMYTSDGLENKKEIALIVPTIKSWGEWDDVHFGDAGKGRAIAWVRFGDTEVIEDTEESKEIASALRELANDAKQKYGEKRSAWPDDVRAAYDMLLESELDSMRSRKILVIDEIQSKRHQEGRDKGYSMSIKEYEQRLDALENERAERLKRRTILLRQLREKYGDDFNSYLKLQDTAYIPNENVMTPEEVQEWYATTQDEIDSAIDNLKKEMHTGIPAAPFEKNWPELAMKRMLRYAAENGYDEVAWTSGKQQSDRYNLGKVINSIISADNGETKRVRIFLKNSDSLLFDVDSKTGKIVSVHQGDMVSVGANLSDVVGKEMADGILNNTGAEDYEGRYHWSGEGLRVGTSGMAAFYDKMLPTFMNKYGKKWGISVSETELPLVESGEGYTFHSVPVTKAMKDSVMEGQPMFYKTPNGTVYGWTDGKKIYLTKAGLNPNTPIHEYTHLWAKAMMQKNPKGWNSIKKLLKGTPIWNEVINDPSYSNIRNNEDLVASEALSRISGSENAAKMEKMAQQMIDEAKGTGRKLEARGLIQNMRDALNKFWNWVGVELFGIEKFESVEQITDRVLWDLMNKTDLGELSEGQVETQIVTDPKVIAELEASPKRTGYRNVVQNEDGTFSSPMAYWLQGTKSKGGAKSRVETAKFEMNKWEEAEEHPELVDESGHIVLVKPNKDTVEVAYDPYIHNRLDPVNLQFKQAWERPDLVYVKTEVPETDLESGYHANGALLPVGVHSWSNGDVMLSKYDKPVGYVPWKDVADAWVARLNGEGVHFDVVPPALRKPLIERGVEILPPHKGMGKDCNDAYKAWKESVSSENSISLSSDINTESNGGEQGTRSSIRQIANVGNRRAIDRGRTEDGRKAQEKHESQYNKDVLEQKYPQRKGNASQELLIDTFGLSAVTIPESETNTLNRLYDFLMEMSKILGISPKAIGHGGWVEIKNLDEDAIELGQTELKTKNHKTTGIVLHFKNIDSMPIAHEWWHSLDYALPIYETGEGIFTALELIDSDFDFDGREETKSALKDLLDAITKSGYIERIKSIFANGKWDYYLNPTEMAGRAFDIYIRDKFADAGIEIEGLSYDYTNTDASHQTQNEMKVISPAIDNLLKILQENDGKIAGTSILRRKGESFNISTEEQNAAVNYLAGPQRTELIQRAVNEEAQKLGVTVTYKTREETPNGHKNDKGYYNTKTGEIVICTENNASIADAIQTVLHEAVAHKGLRKLMGDRFNEFISRVYDSLDADTKAKVDALADKSYNGNKMVAMEEYMANLAETEDFANTSVWDKIKDIFNSIINSILGRNDIKIGDNELRYILRASYANMVNPRNMETIEGWANDTNMRNELGINEASPEIMSRTGIDPTEIAREYARTTYDRVVNEQWQEFQRQFQDAMQPVRIAIDAIQQETGNIPIEDYENYILIQNQASSRSRVEIDEFASKYYSPIIEQINHMIDIIMEKRGWDVKDKKRRAEVYTEVRQYLIAKHGLERNKYYQRTKKRLLNAAERKEARAEAKAYYEDELARIAATYTGAERAEEEQKAKEEYEGMLEEIKTRTTADIRDYSGLTSLFGMEPDEFEFAEAEAEELIKRFEISFGRTDEYDNNGELIIHQGADINRLWNKINAATDKTLKHSYESGMLSRQQYTDISNMFSFYIPLRGFDETTAEDVYAYARFEGNRFNPAVQKAEGRTSVADDPIAIIMNMAESEITQGNKNRAKQALYNYILNRPRTDALGNQAQNSLMQVESVWYIKTTDALGNEVYTIAHPDHEAGETYEEFELRMGALAEAGMAEKSKKGQVDVGMRFQKQMNRNAHYVYLKVNGVDKAIYINGDPKAAEAINGSYRPKQMFGESKFREINRIISSMFTNYSLPFTIRNFARDMFYSHINISMKESDPAYRKAFRRNWGQSLFRVGKMLYDYRNGKFEGADLNEYQAAFVDFMQNGGQTGYTVINSVENHKKDLERAIKNIQKGIKKGGVKDSTVFKLFLGWVEFINETAELVTRFSAYKTSRDMGRGVVSAINDAKEVTVNFNTKGAQDGRGWMGFVSQYFGWSKFFFNASIQGVQNLGSMAQANKLKFCTTVGGIMATGFLMPVITSLVHALMGGDDEEEYWNIPEYDRQNNLCIVVGDDYAKIPLPIGFREMYAIGDMVAAMAFDKKFKRDVWQIGTDMANKIASMVLPINPLESSANGLSLWHTALYTALPSSAQFAIQNATNVDWKGTPLQKEYTYNENDPQWMKAFESNPDWMTGLSKWCNEHIHPDGSYSGWDWSPEKLDNTLSNVFGGIYNVIKQTGRYISKAASGDWSMSNLPIASVAYGSGLDDDNMYITDAYFDMKDYYDKNVNYIKRRAKKFGYDLDDVFLKHKGQHQPKMQEIYSDRNYDFMEEWYKGDDELKKLNDKIKKLEKEIAGTENPTTQKIEKLAELKSEFDIERREFVEDMLELD